MLSLGNLFENEEAATAAAEGIYTLELSIAEKHMTMTAQRDPLAIYNKMSIADMSTLCAGKFDFDTYFQTLGKSVEEIGDINLMTKEAVIHATSLIESTDPDTIVNYLKWQVMHETAPYLSKNIVNENFRFNGTVMSGTKELLPRWKRAMSWTEKALGDAIGKLYCAKYFDEAKKVKCLSIIETVRKALEERLKEVDWMKAETTRESALKKMAGFKVKIGYPDKWIDYSSMKFEEGSTIYTKLSVVGAFNHNRTMNDMNKPTDRVKWEMTPQTINAYYHPSLNEVVFPAAILQPPFFNMEADDAVNYGSMGAIVGHEMTHGFDDQGRKYDHEGNMNDWWTEEDSVEYEKRVQVMVDQANNFEVYGKCVQGKLTCGENIADLGGLRLAYRAFKLTPGFATAPTIGGYTPTQRFFMAWGTAWRQNTTET